MLVNIKSKFPVILRRRLTCDARHKAGDISTEIFKTREVAFWLALKAYYKQLDFFKSAID